MPDNERLTLEGPCRNNALVMRGKKHRLRIVFKSVWLSAELVFAAIRYFITCGIAPSRCLPERRAAWLQASSQRVLRVINTRIHASGNIPQHGLLVSNHLSYLDILVIASLTPAAFVSKHEVKAWPVFGWFARIAGTVFVDRQKRHQTGVVASEMESALQHSVVLVLFPEGRNSNGDAVLPFKSSLLEPAVRLRPNLSAAFICYELDDGDPANEVCYWGDMVLVPHMLNLLSKRGVRAFVRFSAHPNSASDRKHLARELHRKVIVLKSEPLGAANS
ncbi:MAG TPA: lysophospholipid acyltransferase family protein [Verrucomicrobiae bacterium]|nr:lysophospholipid acyltransferase family protein [Verrucomicrobiae bacterium]